MAIDIKVIPTLHGDEAMRFINNADDRPTGIRK